MTDTSPGPIVVVGIDFSEIGDRALDEALLWLAERPSGVVHVVHVAAGYGPMLRLELADDVKTVSREELEVFLADEVRQRVSAFTQRTSGVTIADGRVVTHVRVGVPSDEMVALGAELQADLIVVGTHGRRGVTRLLLGSVAEAIVRKAGCTVLVVRPKDYPPSPTEGAEDQAGA
jgi:nucleotide-binding universal stress UspA family protein